jgi:hypothetical protein
VPLVADGVLECRVRVLECPGRVVLCLGGVAPEAADAGTASRHNPATEPMTANPRITIRTSIPRLEPASRANGLLT